MSFFSFLVDLQYIQDVYTQNYSAKLYLVFPFIWLDLLCVCPFFFLSFLLLSGFGSNFLLLWLHQLNAEFYSPNIWRRFN